MRSIWCSHDARPVRVRILAATERAISNHLGCKRATAGRKRYSELPKQVDAGRRSCDTGGCFLQCYQDSIYRQSR